MKEASDCLIMVDRVFRPENYAFGGEADDHEREGKDVENVS